MTLATVPRYHPDNSSELGGHAVVIGASMAGLLTARVLTDTFEAVTVLEQDRLPDGPIVRKGVPQAHHLHVMHEACRRTLEDLFPGYSEELTAAGAEVLDLTSDLQWFDRGDFIADGPNRIPMYSVTRPVIEQITCRRVAEFDGIQIRDGCQVTEYIAADNGSTIEGVTIRSQATGNEEIKADLVVDATGRTSRTPTWLANHGFSSPPRDEVNIDLAYSTVHLDRPTADTRAYLVFPSPPRTRGAALFPVENQQWLLTLAGVHGDHPPTTSDALGDFLAGLPMDVFHRLLEEQALVSDEVAHYPFPSNIRRRYWELDRFPDGFVVIGDAIASFNPIYGQGMSVAALEAVQLHHTLVEEASVDCATSFFERIAPVIQDAWNLAVRYDFRFPETTGPKPAGTDLFNRYIARLISKAHVDGQLTDAFARVAVMERRPISLLRPRIMWRVLKPVL